MPGDPHPLAVVYGAGNVDKAAVVADGKIGVRRSVADADEVRTTDFSGQFAGLHVRANSADYDLDTEDLSEDDGTNTIIDAAGTHFVRVTIVQSEVQRVHTAAGDVTITADDVDIIIVKKDTGAATTANLPSAGDRTNKVRIADGKYDAATNNITIVPDGSETIMGGANYVIDSNGGSITLTPLADGSGWI